MYSFFRGALRISRINNHNDGLWINSGKSKSTKKIQENYTLEMLCVECTLKEQYHCFFYEESKIFRLHEF